MITYRREGGGGGNMRREINAEPGGTDGSVAWDVHLVPVSGDQFVDQGRALDSQKIVWIDIIALIIKEAIKVLASSINV